jgi:hypothetical protein
MQISPEEPILNLGEFHGSRAGCVVVSDMIDPRADGEAPHQPSIVGLQQIGRRTDIPHPRIKPQIVAVWIEDDWHSVVDGRGHGIRGRGQDRAGLDPLPGLVPSAIPYSRERKQFFFVDFKAIGLLGFPHARPLVKSVCGNQTPSMFKRIAERGLRGRCFRPRIDHAGSDGRVLGP